MAMSRRELAGTHNFTIECTLALSPSQNKKPIHHEGHEVSRRPFLLKIPLCTFVALVVNAHPYYVRQSFPTEAIHEIKIPAVVSDSASRISPCPARTRNRQAFRGRILLQGQMGACRRVSAVVQEEPLPAAEKAGGDGPHAQGLDGPAPLPHDRRRALGLSRDHRVQELDGCE